MKTYSLIALFVFAVLLVACQSATPAGQVETQVAATIAPGQSATAAVEQAVKMTLTASVLLPTETLPPSPTSVPTTAVLPTDTPVPTATKKPALPPATVRPTLAPPTQAQPATAGPAHWAVPFEYRFPAGFWSAGIHQYSLVGSCSGEAPGSVTRDFTVSDNFAPITDDVYLRWAALRKGNVYGEPVEGINPSQSTVAAIVFDATTESEAELMAANCTGTVSWDGGAPQPLLPQTPLALPGLP